MLRRRQVASNATWANAKGSMSHSPRLARGT